MELELKKPYNKLTKTERASVDLLTKKCPFRFGGPSYGYTSRCMCEQEKCMIWDDKNKVCSLRRVN